MGSKERNPSTTNLALWTFHSQILDHNLIQAHLCSLCIVQIAVLDFILILFTIASSMNCLQTNNKKSEMNFDSFASNEVVIKISLTWHVTQLTDSHFGHLNSLTPSSQMHHPSQFANLQWIASRVVISAMRSVRVKYWSNSLLDKMARISRSCKMASHLERPSPNGHATSTSSQWTIAFFKQSRQNWCKQFRNRTPSPVLIVVRQMTQSNASTFVITPSSSSRASNWMYSGIVDASEFLAFVVSVIILLSPVCTPAVAIVTVFFAKLFCISMSRAHYFDNCHAYCAQLRFNFRARLFFFCFNTIEYADVCVFLCIVGRMPTINKKQVSEYALPIERLHFRFFIVYFSVLVQ